MPLTGAQIQARSFAIIDQILAGQNFPPDNAKVIKRVIHATGDPSWAAELVIHERAIESAIAAMRAGALIFTDVHMVKAGINNNKVKSLGGKIICNIRHKETALYAEKHETTRAAAAFRLLSKKLNGSIIVIGNAPSSLQEVCDLITDGKIAPAAIIGTPVGFVGAVESKESLRKQSIPYITNCDRRGGSAVAVSITNALLEIACS